MIRVLHGEEPPELARHRKRHLAKLQAEWKRIDATDAKAVEGLLERHDKLLNQDYREPAAGPLWSAWVHRCAYCGAYRNESDPLDHFRPRRGDAEHGGYWWLTWSWTNLLPACTTCNGAKLNHFPVRGPRLRPFESDVEREQAMLIDPSRENPLEYLDYFCERDHDEERWTVQASDGPEGRGMATTRRFGLDKDDGRYQQHLELLHDLLHDLELERQRGTPATLRELWTRKMRVFAGLQFPALTHAFMRRHYGEVMMSHELDLPPLGDTAPESRHTTPEDRWNLPAQLRLDIDALSKKPEPDVTRAILCRLVELRAWNLDELAEVLPQKAGTLLAKHVRPLVREKRLRYDAKSRRVSAS